MMSGFDVRRGYKGADPSYAAPSKIVQVRKKNPIINSLGAKNRACGAIYIFPFPYALYMQVVIVNFDGAK